MNRAAAVALACLALASATLLLPSAPGYDALAWLVWGREAATLELDTSSGPAWKPLPVLVTTALAPLGEAAAPVWLVLARAAGLLAVVLAAVLAARLAGGPLRVLAGVTAAMSLVLVEGFVRGVALGYSEGILVALVLLAVLRHLDGACGQAFALGVAAALVRPEMWPFLGVYAVWLWLREPARRPHVAAGIALLPLLWFGPELWGSGELLRSSERARVPNPGAPALADRPSLAVVEIFVATTGPLVLTAAAAGIALARRARDRVTTCLAAGGLAWLALVAGMSELGYSGEARYLVPAAALTCVVGGTGAARLVEVVRAPAMRRAAAAAVVAALALAAGLALPRARDAADHLAYAAELHRDLGAAVERAGGPARLRACGSPAAGRYRFPAVAWRVGVPISALGLEPRRPGVVFRSRLTRGSPPEPVVDGAFTPLASAGAWDVLGACASGAR